MRRFLRLFVSFFTSLAWFKVAHIMVYCANNACALAPAFYVPLLSFSSLLGVIFCAFCIYKIMHMHDLFFWEKYKWFKGIK